MAEPLSSSLPPPIADREGTEQSCGDSGKENDIVLWRGSRSSLTSKPSRPRSCHLSDISSNQQDQAKLSLGTAQVSNRSRPAKRVTRQTRSATGKALHSPKNIVMEPSLCSPVQRLKSVSLTPKKNLSRKGFKVNKKQAALPSSTQQSSSNTTPRTKGIKAAKLAKAANTSHKVTEYFPIRRSARKPKGELLKEQMEGIEAMLLTKEDINLGVEVTIIENKGRGIKAVRDFSKGEFVVEYAGELIDIGTAKDLEVKYSMDTSKGCYMYYFKHKGKQFCIDATGESGRYGRLLNHSRVSPNCMTKVVMVGDSPRLILVARSDIVAGTELLYDYGDRSKESLEAHPWLAL